MAASDHRLGKGIKRASKYLILRNRKKSTSYSAFFWEMEWLFFIFLRNEILEVDIRNIQLAIIIHMEAIEYVFMYMLESTSATISRY